MSIVMDEEIKRWTARRKSALVLEIIRGKTTVAEASRQFDLPPAELESWVEDGKRGMENALRAKPEDVREQYERQPWSKPLSPGSVRWVACARRSCCDRTTGWSSPAVPIPAWCAATASGKSSSPRTARSRTAWSNA